MFQSDGKLAWTRSDGSGPVERLAGTREAFPNSFSSDGGRLFFHQPTGGNYDLWDDNGGNGGASFGPPRRLTEDPALECSPAISPDGKWLAYSAAIESDRPEIFVVALSPDGRIGNRKWQVSSRSGRDPIWAKNGRDLFYRVYRGGIMVVSYTAKGNVFVPEKPRIWSDKRIPPVGASSPMTLHPTARGWWRYLMPETIPQSRRRYCESCSTLARNSGGVRQQRAIDRALD